MKNKTYARKRPTKGDTCHIVGIGGIGMSSLAEALLNRGVIVSGSDASDGDKVKKLREKGIKIFTGHAAENIGEAQFVAFSTAVPETNPEISFAKLMGREVINRAELAAAILTGKKSFGISGTHGKTTTTALVGSILISAGMDPEIIIGGDLVSVGSNYVAGFGDWIVFEADESDGSFCRLPLYSVALTSMSREHMNYYKSEEKMQEEFTAFLNGIPDEGFAIVSCDDSKLMEIAEQIDNKMLFFSGLSEKADLFCSNIEINGDISRFTINLSTRLKKFLDFDDNLAPQDVELPIPGMHNISNAALASLAAMLMGANLQSIKEGLNSFRGVRRRFEKFLLSNNSMAISDYAHHPREIDATLKTFIDFSDYNNFAEKVVVLQPHRFTRLNDLFEAYVDILSRYVFSIDRLIIADVFAAGEKEIEFANNADSLCKAISEKTGKLVDRLKNDPDVGSVISSLRSNTSVLFLNSGNLDALLRKNIERV